MTHAVETEDCIGGHGVRNDCAFELAMVVLMITIIVVSFVLVGCRREQLERLDAEHQRALLEAGAHSFYTTNSVGERAMVGVLGNLLTRLNLFRPEFASLGMIPYHQLRVEAQPLASGAGGVVYRGEYLSRSVAIKALYSQMMDERDLVELTKVRAIDVSNNFNFNTQLSV